MSNSTPEEKIVRKVIRGLKAAGNPIVSVYDGEEYVDVRTEKETMEAVSAVDIAVMYTKSGQFVQIVGGNEWDALSDYNTSLSDVLDPIADWAIDQDTNSN